jgi:DNA-binding response OmpR family regulator
LGSREVFEAEDGASGLEATVHHCPDIIITDWMMPIFDGIELTSMIRNPDAKPNPFVPIIMLTGRTHKKNILKARDAGVTEFLAKPVSAKSLYARILNIVANPRPFIKSHHYFGPDRRRSKGEGYTGPERRKSAAPELAMPPLAENMGRHGAAGRH